MKKNQSRRREAGVDHLARASKNPEELQKNIYLAFIELVGSILLNHELLIYRSTKDPEKYQTLLHFSEDTFNQDRFKEISRYLHLIFISKLFTYLNTAVGELVPLLKPKFVWLLANLNEWSTREIIEKLGVLADMVIDRIDRKVLTIDQGELAYGNSLSKQLNNIINSSDYSELAKQLVKTKDNPQWVPLSSRNHRKRSIKNDVIIHTHSLPLTTALNRLMGFLPNKLWLEYKKIITNNFTDIAKANQADLAEQLHMAKNGIKLIICMLMDPLKIGTACNFLMLPDNENTSLAKFKKVVLNALQPGSGLTMGQDTSYGNLNGDLEDIELSRYNLELITEENPMFSDGEIIWINHVRHAGKWRVISHDSKLPVAEVEFCAWCFKPAKAKCSKCTAVKYCSASCQQACWPSHKLKCISTITN